MDETTTEMEESKSVYQIQSASGFTGIKTAGRSFLPAEKFLFFNCLLDGERFTIPLVPFFFILLPSPSASLGMPFHNCFQTHPVHP